MQITDKKSSITMLLKYVFFFSTFLHLNNIEIHIELFVPMIFFNPLQ